MTYDIGPFSLDLPTRELRRGGELRQVEPKVLDLIAYLVENRDRVVGKDEINQALWQGRAVSDAALSGCVKAARRALDDDGTAQAMIRTVHGRGLRFVGDVAAMPAIEPVRTVTAVVEAPSGPEWEAKVGRDADALTVRPRVLVLPFEVHALGIEPFLADGLTDELIAALSAWRWFPIVSRNTSFRYRDHKASAREMSCETGARYLVSAQLRHSGAALAVAVQLVDAVADEVIWVDRFVRTTGDLVYLPDEVARAIVARLVPEIAAAETRRVELSAPDDPSAWHAVLRASWHLNRRAEARDFDEAERLCAIAAERDRAWGAPLAIRAFARFQRAQFGWSGQGAREAFRSTLEAATEALAVDDRSWIAHALCGVGQLWSNRAYDRALWHIHRAVELNPSSSWAYHFYGCVSGFSGRLESALVHPGKAFVVDPAYPYASVIESDLGLWSMLSGDLAAAGDHFGRALASNPSYARALQRRAALRGLMGQQEAARADAQRLATLPGTFDREYFVSSYPFRLAEHRQLFFEGLRAAGLNTVS